LNWLLAVVEPNPKQRIGGMGVGSGEGQTPPLIVKFDIFLLSP